MRITFVVMNWGPRGGTEEYVRAVAQELAQRGHLLQFAYEEQTVAKDAQWQRFMRQHVATQLPARNEARALWLESHLESHRPEVLFIHNAAFPAILLEKAKGRVAVVRFMHDFRSICLRVSKIYPVSRRNCSRALGYGCLLHGCSVGPARGAGLPFSWNGIHARLAEREVSRRMDRLIVASQFMHRLLMTNGFPEERITVLPLFPIGGVPEAAPPVAVGSRLLYLGHINRAKGLPLLLRSLVQLPPTVTLDVAGEGPLRADCRRRAEELGVGSRVHFHGWLGREELAPLLRDACAVVVPSIWNEPFGLVGLDAMAAARPVVAFDVGGISDWLIHEETGLLVSDISSDALARALSRLLADRAQAGRWGQAGYRLLEGRFGRDRHVERLIAALAESGLQRAGAG